MPADRYRRATPAHRPGPTPSQHAADPQSSEETTVSSASHLVQQGQIKLFPLFSRLKIHVVPTKLDGELPALYAQIEALGGTVAPIETCSFAISALKGRPRLERILGSHWVDEKQILGVGFVKEHYELCLRHGAAFPVSGSFSSLSVLARAPTLKARSEYAVPHTGPASFAAEVIDDVTLGDVPPDLAAFDENVPLEEIPSLCIQRRSPLVCVNQGIIDAIKPIYQMREFEDPDQKNSNVLSYRRSMSILKAVPRRLKSGKEAMNLQGLGPKVAERIDEYLQTGHVQEAEAITLSERFQTLNLFSSIFTIGNAKAVELYDRFGCRTLDDVSEHFSEREAAEWTEGAVGQGVPVGKTWQGGRAGREKRRSRDADRRRREGRMSQAEVVREWVALKDEIDEKIPRTEVEEIGLCVKQHLDALLPGCRYTLTGGYRRGKTESNDVDVVFCPPEEGMDTGLLKDLYLRLGDFGIVTHILQITSSSHHIPVHNNFDGLDKAFVLFRLPPKPGSSERRLHRRVDLISSPKRTYALAVLGWSGSMMFERDLRRRAADVYGLKFDSGSLQYKRTGEELFPQTEHEIFQLLGLEYVPPEYRNADG